MSQLCRCRCRAARLGFSLDEPETWQELFSKPGGFLAGSKVLTPKAYVRLRIFMCVLWGFMIIWEIIDWCQFWNLNFKYWLTKLTHWGAVWEWFYFLFAAITSYKAVHSERKVDGNEGTPCVARATTCFGAAVMVVSCLIFFLYWLLVYTPGSLIRGSTLAVHGGNFFLLLLDLLLLAQKTVFWEHIHVAFGFALTYSLFTAVYFAAGGTFEDNVSPYIYSALDWKARPVTTLVLLIIINCVVVPCMYSIFQLVFYVRGLIRGRCCRGKEEDPPTPQMASVIGSSTAEPENPA